MEPEVGLCLFVAGPTFWNISAYLCARPSRAPLPYPQSEPVGDSWAVPLLEGGPFLFLMIPLSNLMLVAECVASSGTAH